MCGPVGIVRAGLGVTRPRHERHLADEISSDSRAAFAAPCSVLNNPVYITGSSAGVIRVARATDDLGTSAQTVWTTPSTPGEVSFC